MSTILRVINVEVILKEGRISFEEPKMRKPEPYAILSHTWQDDQEVTYTDVLARKDVKSKKGFDKIRATCNQAKKNGIKYVWIDTCCIDKSSSSELTEAINSMFAWYQDASFCYVYLEDVINTEMDDRNRWFTRGWTLQELIAPKEANNMIFFNSSWLPIGTKLKLVEKLSSITKVDIDILLHKTALSSVCIGRRLFWAANRNTTRIEDEAYCLLGILGINMPTIYGEKHRALYRLQEEIVKYTNDLTVLAWTPHNPSPQVEYCGFFAQTIKDFASCSTLESLTEPLLTEIEMSVTNKGIKLRAPEYIWFLKDEKVKYQYALKIDAKYRNGQCDMLGLSMQKIGPSTFLRVRYHDHDTFDLVDLDFEENELRDLILLTKLPEAGVPRSLQEMVSSSRHSFVQIKLPPGMDQNETDESPIKCWDVQGCGFLGTRGSLHN